MIIHITIKGQEIKLTRKEYLRKYAVHKPKNPYNDKMHRSNHHNDSNINPRIHYK